MISQTTDDYREILSQELAQRRLRNPSYSQRAFARDLGIGPNRLSEILRGKQGLSPRYARQIAASLGLKNREQSYFCEIVRMKHARSKREKAEAAKRVEGLREEINYHRIDPSVFAVISEWHHLAIVELSKTKAFQAQSSWIAKRLGMKEREVKEALGRLERVGLLERTPDGFRFIEGNNNIPGNIPSDWIKRFHEGILRKATDALWRQPLERREFSSTLIAVDDTALPEIKRRIDKFWRQIDREFGATGDANQVYSLSTQFFSVTEAENAGN